MENKSSSSNSDVGPTGKRWSDLDDSIDSLFDMIANLERVNLQSQAGLQRRMVASENDKNDSPVSEHGRPVMKPDTDKQKASEGNKDEKKTDEQKPRQGDEDNTKCGNHKPEALEATNGNETEPKQKAAEDSKVMPASKGRFLGKRRVIELPTVHQRGTPQTLLEYLDMGHFPVRYADDAQPERPVTYVEDVFELVADSPPPPSQTNTPEHKEKSSAVETTPSPEINLSEDQPTHQEPAHVGSRLSKDNLSNPQESQPSSSVDMTIRDGELPARSTQANGTSATDDLLGGHGLESSIESSEAIDTASSQDDESVHQENDVEHKDDQNLPTELSLANDGATSQKPEPESPLPQNQLLRMKDTAKEVEKNEPAGEPIQAEKKPADEPSNENPVEDEPSEDDDIPVLQKQTEDMPFEPPADGSAKVLYTFWEAEGYRRIGLFNMTNQRVTEKELKKIMRRLRRESELQNTGSSTLAAGNEPVSSTPNNEGSAAEIKRVLENFQKKMDARIENMWKEFDKRYKKE
ncbi:hypothetical protein CkaCkLH20_09839 [Colletotrichum karsti]|uniref:Uncharacterized protein n=1 Tax=Colletotrichum karsti TaxID=1095194 RepID=A0A9P6HYT8_9PEZI|nr:uncharacterized protein CkaCkLH20_09839 [Colletotrichum karsti]KAF9872660.1 hypothetical protein CkaCkLH20_09839 [Colletotrichum karsti]